MINRERRWRQNICDVVVGLWPRRRSHLDSHDTAAILTEVFGRPITAVQIPFDLLASRLPECPFRDGMRRMMAHYDRYGLPRQQSTGVATILGGEPRSLKDYFRELASR